MEFKHANYSFTIYNNYKINKENKVIIIIIVKQNMILIILTMIENYNFYYIIRFYPFFH